MSGTDVKKLIETGWDFTCQDGTVLPMRRMDSRERDFYNAGAFGLLYGSWGALAYSLYKPSASWEACYTEALNFCTKLSSTEATEFVLANFQKTDFLPDLINFLKEIMIQEGYLMVVDKAAGAAVPTTPEAVDELDNGGAERLGESLGALVLQQTTTPSTEAAETCSSSQPSDQTAAPSETSETSPQQS